MFPYAESITMMVELNRINKGKTMDRTKKRIYSWILIFVMVMVSWTPFTSSTYANNQATQSKAPTYVTTGKITATGQVNVRESFTTQSAVLGQLTTGDRYEILEAKYTSETSTEKNTIWYKIKSNQFTGYIRADFSSLWHDAYAKGKTTGKVNIRSGAGLKFEATGSIAKNTEVSVGLKVIAANGNEWYKVRHNGSFGYVSALYLSVEESIVTDQNNPDEDNTTEEATMVTSGTVSAASGVNLRESYSINSPSQGLLAKGTQFIIDEVKYTSATSTAKNTMWYKVNTGSQSGYVRADKASVWHKTYAKGVTTGSVAARAGAGVGFEKKTTVSKGTDVKIALKAIAANGKAWYKINQNGSFRYVSSLYVSLAEAPPEQPEVPDNNDTTDDPQAGETIGTVTASEGITVRSGYSSENKAVGTLAKGAQFTIEEVKYTSNNSAAKNTLWYKIKTATLSGYVRADGASLWHKASSSGVMTGNAAVRAGAGVDFEKKATAAKGTEVKVVLKAVAANGKGWYKIKYDGGFNYVSALYLSMDEADLPWDGEEEKPTNPTVVADVAEGQGTVMSKTGVTVRKSPSSSSSAVTTLPYQTVVTVMKEQFTSSSNLDKIYKWYYIKSSSVTGYVRSDAVSIKHGSYVKGNATATVNVRKGAGTGFSVSESLSKGAAVKIVLNASASNGGNWYKIYKDGAYGYVSAQYVSYDVADDQTFEEQLTAEGFPESYKVLLRQVHQVYPNWKFKSKQLAFTWADAFAKQTSNYRANTIDSGRAEPYKAVRSGTYNFTTHQYISLDGSGWVGASKATVGYYMDPRNWLVDANGEVNGSIFMFEKQSFDPAIHTESAVKRILSYTGLPSAASAYYMEAAETYDISPIYLAVKTRLELGSSSFMVDGHEFSYGGKKYSNCYNVFNIGASDSSDGSAATKGLVYAAGGSDGSGTSYGRPWNTLKKAVLGGTQFIQENYKGSTQYLPYYERFNVVGGLDAIGTYQYATSSFYASTQGQLIYQNYDELDILNEGYVFEIPVYQNMPTSLMPRPQSTGNNNCYLDSIKVSASGTTLTYGPTFSRFTSTYTVNETVPATVNSLDIVTKTNVSDAKVTITGNSLKAGENKVTIKCTSSTGIVKYYYIKVNKASS
ncbi:uncharacterized protein YgiM (DUF1202 family)/beta-N-acetylglucosaminidase [Clostridiales Family XIII bacterium PM5-7]